MCNILWLKAGQMPLNKEEFWNMCYNNWHSYGLSVRIDGRLDTKRVVPKSGEIDPQEVWDSILRDRQYERFLHVRHTTSGLTNVDNCHPFDVFYQERKGKVPRDVKFMHNGTLYEYKSKKLSETGSMVDDDSGPSDTQNYVSRVLVPYLTGLDVGDGKGDISSPLVRDLLKKFWPLTGNRGLLYSGDQEPVLLGDWKKMKASDGSDIISANDDYFDKVIRGPEKERRDQAEAAKRTSTVSSFRTTVSGVAVTVPDIVPFTKFDFSFKDKQRNSFDLTTSFAHILGDWNVWDRGTAVALGAATVDELTELYDKDKKSTIQLMDWIFADYAQLYDEYNEINDKHKKATERIATIQGELNELRKWCADNGYFDKNKKAA